MLAILTKLIPLKDWCYLGIIVSLLIGFGVYTHHERVIGAQTIVAADTRAAQKQAAIVAKVESSAHTEIQNATKAYAAAISAVPTAAPSIVCHSVAPSRSAVPGNAGASGDSDGTSAVPTESSVPFDPAPAVIKDASDADAQVTLLQAYITACQHAGVCKE